MAEKQFMLKFDGMLPPSLQDLSRLEIELTPEVAASLASAMGCDPVLVEKSITENGTYDPADDEADGYSSVEVNVSGGGGGNITSYVYFNPSSVTGLALTVNGQPVELANSEMGEWFKEFTAPAGAVVEYTSTSDDTPPTLYVYGSDEDITEHPYNYFGVWEFSVDETPETERWFPALAHTVAAFSSFG